MLTIGSLFSGIGGLELGLERAGLGPVKWQVEIDPYCRDVLAKHWPDVERFDDIRTVGRGNLAPVDLICGGFPCQNFSSLGIGGGLSGAKSGLWFEFARIIGEIRPCFVVVENVVAITAGGLDGVLGSLAALGFDAIWFPVAAGDVGATHLRDRVFVIGWNADSHDGGEIGCLQPRSDSNTSGDRSGSWWATEPHMDRVVNGFPGRVDRIHALGNAVVPQVAEVVGWVVRGIHERLTQCC